MIKYSEIVLPRRHQRRAKIKGFVLGFCVATTLGFCAASFAQSPMPQCPDRQEIIEHYLAVAICKGKGETCLNPELMPPERKPSEGVNK